MQMAPGRFCVGHRLFAVDPHGDVVRPLRRVLRAKTVVDGPSSTARHQPRLPPREPHPVKEGMKSLLAADADFFGVGSAGPAFDVDVGAHQRFPPNCPSIHS